MVSTDITTSVALLTLAVSTTTGVLTRYNTSLACLSGSDVTRDFQIDCYSIDPSSVILVQRIIHGITPQSNGCNVTAPASACCPNPFNAARDCVFTSDEKLKKLKERCDETVTCYPTLDRVSAGGLCPAKDGGLTYGKYSNFGLVEYSCINTNQMSNVCGANSTLVGEELFLVANFFHQQRLGVNSSCSCVITTACQQTLLFEVLDLDLASDSNGTCLERAMLTGDSSAGVPAVNLGCNYTHLSSTNYSHGQGKMLISEANVARFHLHLLPNSSGMVLVRVTAADGSGVRVLCGEPANQPFSHQSQCSSSTPSESTTRQSPQTTDLISPTYNTTAEACLQGSRLYNSIEMDCANNGLQGVISVEHIFHGLTPNSMGCNISAPKTSCCPGYDPERDCLFASDEGLGELREKCDGATACYPVLTRATVGEACPPRQGGNITYGRYSYFAFVEYSCINTGLLSDMCDVGNTVHHTEVYLESNVYHQRSNQANITCSCVVSTECQHNVFFYPLTFHMTSGDNSICLEQVILQDGSNSSVKRELDCNSSEVEMYNEGEKGPVFSSHSNLVNFQLRLQDRSTGKMLFRIVASDAASVEVRCGRTAVLDPWEKHQCSSPHSPSTVVNDASSSSTVSFVMIKPDYEDNRPNIGLAVGVAILAFLILIVIFGVMIILCRYKKRQRLNFDYQEGNNSVCYIAGSDEITFPSEHVYHSLAEQDYTYLNPVKGSMESEQRTNGIDQRPTLENNINMLSEGAVGGVLLPFPDKEDSWRFSKS